LFSDIFSPFSSFFALRLLIRKNKSGNKKPKLAKLCRIAALVAAIAKNKKGPHSASLLVLQSKDG
jgi:hypothetical protein